MTFKHCRRGAKSIAFYTNQFTVHKKIELEIRLTKKKCPIEEPTYIAPLENHEKRAMRVPSPSMFCDQIARRTKYRKHFNRTLS